MASEEIISTANEGGDISLGKGGKRCGRAKTRKASVEQFGSSRNEDAKPCQSWRVSPAPRLVSTAQGASTGCWRNPFSLDAANSELMANLVDPFGQRRHIEGNTHAALAGWHPGFAGQVSTGRSAVHEVSYEPGFEGEYRVQPSPVADERLLCVNGIGAESTTNEDITTCTMKNAQSEDSSYNHLDFTGDGLVIDGQEVKKYVRHNYDNQIDPNLPLKEQRKQRRILSNRASARRSRLRKQQRLDFLLEKEKRLTQERDSVLAVLNEQIKQNAMLSHRVRILQDHVDLLAKKDTENVFMDSTVHGTNEDMLLSGWHIGPATSSSAILQAPRSLMLGGEHGGGVTAAREVATAGCGMFNFFTAQPEDVNSRN